MIDAANDNIELDITRARTLLDWKPRHSLRDTFPKMVSGLKADPFAWYRENELDLPLWLKELRPMPKTNKEVMKSHELMQLAEQVRKEIEGTAASMPLSPPPASEKSKKGHHDEMIDIQHSGGEVA